MTSILHGDPDTPTTYQLYPSIGQADDLLYTLLQPLNRKNGSGNYEQHLLLRRKMLEVRGYVQMVRVVGQASHTEYTASWPASEPRVPCEALAMGLAGEMWHDNVTV